ncbi:MAG: PBP1A family penicillin-binding protein [Desulfobulbus sp.]|nr:PBP1A family penicillin-binding protein [Desulfobulbus sp.]
MLPHEQHYSVFIHLSTLATNQPEQTAEPPPFRGRTLDQHHLTKLLLVIAGTLTLLIGTALAWFSALPDIRSINDYHPQVATLILDRKYQPIDAIGREFRILIPYEEFPPLLPKAFVAAEDSRFWEHDGLDIWSIVRAAFNNIRSGRRSQGGSTITQQVTRALLLSREKSYTRKLAEAILSYRLEHMLSKEEILTIYLNEIYLGEGAYGVEAASRTYFGKHARDLNLGEVALLAGLPQSPSNYSPLRQPEAARNRQRYVLNRMAEDGIIDNESARHAFDQGLQLAGNWRKSINGYFGLYIRSQLLGTYSEQDLFQKGLSVATTVDSRLQEFAAKAIQAGVTRVAMRHLDTPPPQGALVAIDSRSGHVLAMIGGADFTENQFNRAVQANRQPGSAFKPIVYAAALEQGVVPSTRYNDAPISLDSGGKHPWRPHNFMNKYRGPIPLGEALVQSSNVIAVRLLQQIGVDAASRMAKKLGINAPLADNLTLALGASPVSLLELTSAYTCFANQGIYPPPVAITRVREQDGTIRIWPRESALRVVSDYTAAWMQEAMRQVVQRGTGKNAFGVPGAVGKTGTTDNNIDAWFIGSARGLTAGVWFGHDRDTTLGTGETGGKAAAPSWKHFMQQALN